MQHFHVWRLARKAALAVMLLSLAGHAGENRYLGAIVVSGSSSLNNTTTAAPFAIPPGAKLTLYTTGTDIRCLTDSESTATSGPTKGVPIPASTLFPTSVGQRLTTVSGSPSALLACIGTGTVDVWQRAGTE